MMRLTLVLACLLPVTLSPASGAGEALRPRITGLSHVALWVADLEKSRDFYKAYLGFDEPYTLRNADGSVALTWIKVNDRQSVELFPLGGRTPADGDSLYHVALETDDAQAMLRYLSARGVRGPEGKPLPATAGKGRIGNLNFFAEDPDHHTVEFVQYLPDGWTLANAGKFLPPRRVAARMSHAGITVANLSRSLAFYRDILGMKETWRGSGDGVTLSWVNERLPEGSDYIELMLVKARPALDELHILHHICLEVADVSAAGALLGGRALPAGCKPMSAARTGRNHKRQVNCYDPDGTRVEIMEPSTVDGLPAPSSAAPAP